LPLLVRIPFLIVSLRTVSVRNQPVGLLGKEISVELIVSLRTVSVRNQPVGLLGKEISVELIVSLRTVSVRNQPVGLLGKEISVELSCYFGAIYMYSSGKARLAKRPRPLSSTDAQRGFAGGENPLSKKSFRCIDFCKQRLEPLWRREETGSFKEREWLDYYRMNNTRHGLLIAIYF